ncbi:hypothetical protein QNE49_000346 [Vibrio fluvialis]|nr:hypothetical protein [Vibrio fluvialis]
MIELKQNSKKESTKVDVRTSMKAMLAYERLPPRVLRRVEYLIEELKRGHEAVLRREKLAGDALFAGRIDNNYRLIYRKKSEHTIEVVGVVDMRATKGVMKVEVK